MRRQTVKKIFWFFILFLPLQYAAVGIVGVLKSEPWPALILPAFKSVFDQSSEITVSQPRFFALSKYNTKSLKIEPAKLFSKIKDSQRLGFLRTHFSNSNQVDFNTEAKLWIKNRITRIYPDWQGDAVKVVWLGKKYQYSGSLVQLDTVTTIQSFIIPLNGGPK